MYVSSSPSCVPRCTWSHPLVRISRSPLFTQAYLTSTGPHLRAQGIRTLLLPSSARQLSLLGTVLPSHPHIASRGNPAWGLPDLVRNVNLTTLRTALRPLHHPFPLTFPSDLHLHPHLFPSQNGMARRIFVAPRASVAMFCGGFSVIGLPVSCTCTVLGVCTSLTGRPGARFGGGRTHARVQPVGSIQARSSDTGARRLSPDCTGYCRSLLAVRRPPVRPKSGHMPYGHSHASCSSHPTHLLGSLQLLTRAMANHANPWFADVDTDSFHLTIRPRPFSSFRRPPSLTRSLKLLLLGSSLSPAVVPGSVS
ncbi:hypothetical protein GQ607_005048 [Colletotrichum asianum]|uniref:Uncharacterized protein n=1 Tax=Colletotrichum asianum TaxID=702518 RepID=A0A8H3WIP8_9PEZI|nr:hypothetical protein GQ607_005048 [Colletotrichum asianum]